MWLLACALVVGVVGELLRVLVDLFNVGRGGVKLQLWGLLWWTWVLHNSR